MPSRLALARRFPGRRFAFLVMPLALAAGLLPAAPAGAMQRALLQLAQAPSDSDVGGFSRPQLEAYASAVLKVQQIDREWQPKIDQAQNEEEAKALTNQATDQMIGGIEAEGLSVQEYNAITQAAEKDDQLYQHIMTLLAQAK